MKKKLALMFLVVCTCFFAQIAQAEVLVYTFEGTITSFMSYNDSEDFDDIDDFGIVLGQKVAYVIEVDFDANVDSYTNDAGTWEYFYSNTISGSIINGMEENTPEYGGFNWNRTNGPNMGQLSGPKNDIRIGTTELETDNWRVQDWELGQTFKSTDLGCFPDGTSGCAVYAFGRVVLTSIESLLQDADNDGINDEIDNCPFEPNPDQTDADEDGAGDICDRCPNDPEDDFDSDGICGNLDQCPETYPEEIVNGDGCSIADLCPAVDNRIRHIICVIRVAREFIADELISEEDARAIIREAASSSN